MGSLNLSKRSLNRWFFTSDASAPSFDGLLTRLSNVHAARDDGLGDPAKTKGWNLQKAPCWKRRNIYLESQVPYF